jgi:hypothetical protein
MLDNREQVLKSSSRDVIFLYRNQEQLMKVIQRPFIQRCARDGSKAFHCGRHHKKLLVGFSSKTESKGILIIAWHSFLTVMPALDLFGIGIMCNSMFFALVLP